ncbi:SRPBCC domain-containing protein [Rhizobium sp. TRM95111]|uniref:SRPBCC domain-containing protein n=1 Tax=Rhizobium alarense TaxID=2846851 RepID=UPI001F46C3E6|nr:SRPBCC domain-containing protein [Rhizobium alarense]MCF3641908.1 SRPBCC domain-containing protein [Rhizobium alarense]
MTMQHRMPENQALELYIEHVFDAPVALVFRAWTSPEQLARWWGPKDFTPHSIRMDFRPGGAWSAAIRSPGGQDHAMSGVYREIVENEWLVFTFAWNDEASPIRETLVTVTFESLSASRTRIGFRQSPFETVDERDGHEGGWSECLDRLDAYLTGDPRV